MSGIIFSIIIFLVIFPVITTMPLIADVHILVIKAIFLPYPPLPPHYHPPQVHHHLHHQPMVAKIPYKAPVY